MGSVDINNSQHFNKNTNYNLSDIIKDMYKYSIWLNNSAKKYT